MEEKRLILALAVSIGFFALWSWMFPPPKPAPAPEPAGVVSDQGISPEGLAGPGDGIDPGINGHGSATRTASGFPDAAVEPARPAVAAAGTIAAGFEEEIEIRTPLQTIRLSNRGARVTSWRLEHHADANGEPLDLVSEAGQKLDHLPLQILVQDAEATARLKNGFFKAERRDEVEDGVTITTVSFTFSDGIGIAATKVLRVRHDSYISELEVAVEIGGRAVSPTLVWGAGFGGHTRETAGGFGQLAQGAAGIVRIGERIDRRLETKITQEDPWVEAGAIAWAGLEDKYFAALILPESSAPGQIRVESMRLVEEGREAFYLSFALQQPGGSKFRLFVGPKDYDLLKGLGYGLDRLLDFGFFGFIALPLFHALKFLESYTGNYGWAIVILTICIRGVFFPFMHRGQLKMRKMQDKMKRINPKIKALRERYRRLEKKEVERGKAGARQQVRQKLNEEMMALYKQEEINPLGSMSGCLPLLVQMPILYGFYTILTISIELRMAPFMLWIGDLSHKDPYYVTPIVMGATMLIQQMMTSSSIADPAQRKIMYIMPIMFTYFFINLPSGLVLYWLVNNLLGIGQQYFINKEADAAKAAA